MEQQQENQQEEDRATSRAGASESDETDDEDFYDPLDPYSAWEHFYQGRKMQAQFDQLFKLTSAHNETLASEIHDQAPWNDAPTRAAHNIEQRLSWQNLCRKVAADASISAALFNPPEPFVNVVFIRDEQNWFCCPCAIPDQKCSYMALSAPVGDGSVGVTKNMLLEKIGHALYGEADGCGWQVGEEDERPVFVRFTSMHSSGKLVGDIYAVLRGIKKTETGKKDQDNIKKLVTP